MRQIWVPDGFGHAFATLSEFAEVQYKCTGLYTPPSEGTVAWNDPDIGIDWPFDDPILSGRDQNRHEPEAIPRQSRVPLHRRLTGAVGTLRR